MQEGSRAPSPPLSFAPEVRSETRSQMRTTDEALRRKGKRDVPDLGN